MTNCTMAVKGNKLMIEIDLSKRYGKSSSGKTVIVATTKGNIPVPDMADIKIGLNVYTKVEEAS